MPNDKTEKNKELELRLNEFSGVITKSGSILIKLNSGKTLEEAITDLINENIKLKKKVKELEDEKIDKVKWMELLKEVLGKENFDENGKYKGAASTATQQPATSPSQTQKPGSTAKEDPWKVFFSGKDINETDQTAWRNSGFSIDDAKTVYDNGWRNITNKYSSEGQTSEGIDQKKHQKGEIEKVHKLLNKIDKQTDLSNLPKDSQINIITYDENKVPSSINYANVKKNRDDKKLKLFRNVFEGNNPPTPRINDDDLKKWLDEGTGLSKTGTEERTVYNNGWADPTKISKGKQNYEGLAVKVLFHNKEEIDKVNNLIKEINSKKNFKELDGWRKEKKAGESDSTNEDKINDLKDNKLPESNLNPAKVRALWSNNWEASDIKDNGEGDIQVTNPDDSEHPLVGFDAINVDKLTLGQTAWREGMVGGSAGFRNTALVNDPTDHPVMDSWLTAVNGNNITRANLSATQAKQLWDNNWEASDIQNDGSDNVQVIHPTSGEKVIGYDKIIALGDKSVLKSTSTTPVTTLPATDQGKGGANTDQTAVSEVLKLWRTKMGGVGIGSRNKPLDGTGNNSLDNAIMDDWFKKTKTGGGSILDDGRQKEDVEWKFKVKRSTFSYFLNEPYNEVNGDGLTNQEWQTTLTDLSNDWKIEKRGVSTAKIINQFLQDNEVEFTDEKGNKITTSDPNKVEDMTPWLIGLGGFDTTKEDENEVNVTWDTDDITVDIDGVQTTITKGTKLNGKQLEAIENYWDIKSKGGLTLPYFYKKCGFDPENPEFCEVGNPQKGLLPIGTGVGKTTKTVACLCNGGQKNAVLVCPNKGLAQSAYDNHSSWLQKWGCVYHKFNRRIVEEEVVKVDEKTGRKWKTKEKVVRYDTHGTYQVVLNDVIISKKKLADKDEKDNDIPGTEKLRWGVSIMDPGHFDGFLTRAVWNKQRFQDPSDNNKTKIAPNLLKPYGPTGKEKGTELVPNVTADTVKEIKTKKIPDDVIILFDEAHLTFNSTYRELFEDAIELGYNVLKMSATFPGKPFSITTTFPRKNLYMNYLPESYKNSDGEVVDFNAQLAKSRIGIFLKDVVNKEVIEDKKNKKTIIKENSLVTKVLSDENIPYVIINETNQKFFETITSGMPDGSVVIIDNSREMGYTPNFDIIICSGLVQYSRLKKNWQYTVSSPSPYSLASMVQQIGRVARIMNGTAIILSKKTQEPKTEILDRKGNKIEDVAVHVVRAALMGNMDSLKEISFGKNLNLLRAAISLPGDCDNEDDKTGKFGLPPEVLIVGAAGTQTASYVKPTFHRELTTFSPDQVLYSKHTREWTPPPLDERETREILKMMVQTYINKDKEFPKQLHTTVISSLIGQLYDGSDPKNKGRGLGQFKLEVEDVEKIFHTVMKDKLAEVDIELATNPNKIQWPASEKDKFSKIVDIYRLVLGTKVDIPWRDIDPDDPNKGKNLVVELKYPAPIGKRAIFLESEEEKQLKSKIKFILEAANLNIFDEVKEVLERDTLEGYDILAIELRTSPLCNKLIDAIGTNRANKVVYELEQLMRNLEQLQTNIGVNTGK